MVRCFIIFSFMEKKHSYEKVKVSDLKDYERNARTHSEKQVKQVAESIKQFGFTNPVLIDSENVLIAGHGRLKAAKMLGLETVPAIRVNGLTETEIKALRIADNQIALNSGWDEDLLAQELNDIRLDDFDLDVIGFDEDFLDGLLSDDEQTNNDNEAAEAVPEKPKALRVKKGDVWILGEHRLCCGDSTKKEDVEKLMVGEKADLFLSDPPYGINVVTNKEPIETDEEGVGGGGHLKFRQGVGGGNIIKGNNYVPIIGDDSTESAEKSYKLACEYTTEQIIFGGNYFTKFLPPKRCWIVWDKQNGENDFADFELAWTSFDKSARLFKYLWNGLVREGSQKVEGKKRVHPTQKPVGLLVQIVEKLYPKCESILDLFGGSGSTLIAAQKLDKKCFIMELSPDYCDIIIDRWEEFTGKKAHKENK